MKLFYKRNKKVKPPTYGSESSFCEENRDIWYICREEFHWYVKKWRPFYYKVSGYKQTPLKEIVNRLVRFVKTVESAIGIPEKDRCHISKTNHEEIIHVSPGNFWRHSKIKRSLLTLLMRIGEFYKPGDDWKEILHKKCPYLKRGTPAYKAILRLTNGYTKLKLPPAFDEEEISGWVSCFNFFTKKINRTIEDVLIKKGHKK